MKHFVIVFAVTLFAVPALAQPSANSGTAGRLDDDRMREIDRETRDREDATIGSGSQTGGVNAQGERLICRRASHGSDSRLSRARRMCLTEREWRRRQ